MSDHEILITVLIIIIIFIMVHCLTFLGLDLRWSSSTLLSPVLILPYFQQSSCTIVFHVLSLPTGLLPGPPAPALAPALCLFFFQVLQHQLSICPLPLPLHEPTIASFSVLLSSSVPPSDQISHPLPHWTVVITHFCNSFDNKKMFLLHLKPFSSLFSFFIVKPSSKCIYLFQMRVPSQ